MSSYLNIYLEKKKKDGEEKGERLLLVSICRVNDIYSIFYDNDIGRMTEDNMHEFSVSDLDKVAKDTESCIAKAVLDMAHLKETLPLISDKATIESILEQINDQRQYLDYLDKQNATINALCMLLSDVGEDWSGFDKIYWRIE